MNLISLYYFVVLSRELHVTNAAQNLYISQQNLSQHIQRLEQYYNVRLFNRKPRLSLTYEGQMLYETAVRMLSEEEEFRNLLAESSKLHRGSLKLGIPAYRAAICLPSILPRFYDKWPNVRIELCSESSGKMIDMTCRGELDLLICVMYQDDPRLDTTLLLNDLIYLICSDELLRKYYPDNWEQLKEESLGGAELKSFAKLPFMMPNPSMTLRKSIDKSFQEAGVKPDIFLETQSTELFASFYPYNYGAFFYTQMRMPALLAQYPDVNAFPLKFKNEVVKHRLVLAHHRDRHLPEYASDFISISRKTFNDIAELRLESKLLCLYICQTTQHI